MSDQTPPTPSLPGVGITWYPGSHPAEHGQFLRLPTADATFGTDLPDRECVVRLNGTLTLPAPAGSLVIEAPAGSTLSCTSGRITLWHGTLRETARTPAIPLPADHPAELPLQLECHHPPGTGRLRLLFQSTASSTPSAIPASSFHDCWGRFLTNEGKPADWWLQLSRHARLAINGRLPASLPMPTP